MSAELEVHDDHGEHHDHPSWLAHHFDDAEQQFDSGKLGMWMFLVTEVLFFSGMFCAYALLRSSHPAVFQYCSEFLNEKLGAINTGVLLFSSLTMAWAVRASQLSQHKLLVALLGTTLGCAAVFLGVKTVEYSHKWDLGLLPGRMYKAQVIHPDHISTRFLGMDVPTALPYLQMPGLILFGIFSVWWLFSLLNKKSFQMEVAGPLAIAAACYVGGAYVGLKLEEAPPAAAGHEHAAHDHADASHSEVKSAEVTPVSSQAPAVAADPTQSVPDRDSLLAPAQQHADQVAADTIREGIPSPEVNQRGKAGLFFSIYYCMTGVHALHILGGMLVITWLIVKAARHEFHSKYFGPVDNVGLYWHLVDFIWIYLFPLLYLI